MYTLLEDDMESDHKWYEDAMFVNKMKEDVKRIESGEDESFTMEELANF